MHHKLIAAWRKSFVALARTRVLCRSVGSCDAEFRTRARPSHQQAAIGLLEACALSVVGLVRVLMFEREMGVAGGIAVAWALFFIVLSSVLLGTMLPLALWRLGIDPAHAGPGIQVLMDILGVALSCTAMAMLT